MTNKDTAILALSQSRTHKIPNRLKVIDSPTAAGAGVINDTTREAIAIDLYNRWLKDDNHDKLLRLIKSRHSSMN